jgi:LPS sulfotransferase NodH
MPIADRLAPTHGSLPILNEAIELLAAGQLDGVAQAIARLEALELAPPLARDLRNLQYQAAAAFRAARPVPSGGFARRVLRMPPYRPEEILVAQREIAAIFDPLAELPRIDASAAREGKPYTICMTPRSGSTFLVQCLRETGLFGKPDEYLNRHEPTALPQLAPLHSAPSLDSFIHVVAAKTRAANGRFGIKLDPTMLLPLLVEGTFDRLLAHGQFIYITRRDVLMQAISLTRAEMTGAWSAKVAVRRAPVFNFAAIHHNVMHLAEMTARWELFFALNDVRPLRICYEDIEQNIDAVISRMAEFLGVDLPAPTRFAAHDTRQRDDLNTQWREAFLAVFEKPSVDNGKPGRNPTP